MKKFFDKKYLGAAFLVAFGVVFLLDNLFGFNSYVAFELLLKFWPLALIIPGIMIFVNGAENEDGNCEKNQQDEKEKKSESCKDTD